MNRELPMVVPLTSSSPQSAWPGFFPNGASGDPVRGLAIARLDVRQATVVTLSYTGGAASDLPIRSNATYAAGIADDSGWPDLWAFGGRKTSGALTASFYRTTHTVASNGTPTYTWQAVSASGPAAREDAALAVNYAGTRVYVVGGRADSTLFGDAWAYDVGTNAWSTVGGGSPVSARYDATVAVRGDVLYVGGGVGSGPSYLGDLTAIDGVSGSITAYGNVLPTGGRPSLAFDSHGDGLVYGGGYVGSMWYRDLFMVTLNPDHTATTAFVHDFSWDGLIATVDYAVVADIHHGFFWGVPGYASSGNPGGVYFLQDATATVIQPGGGASLLAAPSAGGGSTTNPPRATVRPRSSARASVIRPGARRAVDPE